jgi:hypothetical protein
MSKSHLPRIILASMPATYVFPCIIRYYMYRYEVESRALHHKRRPSSLARISDSSTIAYPQIMPIEKPTAYTGGRNEIVVKKERRNSRSSKLSTKIASMSRMEQRRERSKGGIIEKGEDLGNNETSLSFPPFW